MGAQFTANKRCLQFPRILKVMQRAMFYISTEKQEKKSICTRCATEQKMQEQCHPRVRALEKH